jgi:hypothetical protein
VVEQRLVAGSRRVVELVDDDHVEVLPDDVGDIAGGEALDRGEHVVPAGRTLAADPSLAEGAVTQDVTKRRAALVQDLAAVGDEQQARPVELLP